MTDSKLIATAGLEKIANGAEPMQTLIEVMNGLIAEGHHYGSGEDLPAVISSLKGEVEEVIEAIEDDNQGLKHISNEIGDVFFNLLNLCRYYDLNPNEIIDKTANRWLRRKSLMENKVYAKGYQWDNLPWEVSKGIWKEVKTELKTEEYK